MLRIQTMIGAIEQMCAHPNKQPCIYYNEQDVRPDGWTFVPCNRVDTLARVVVWQAERPRIHNEAGEIGGECWYECQLAPGTWVWSPRCLLYQSDPHMFGMGWWMIYGTPGAPVLVQRTCGYEKHNMDMGKSTLAVCAQLPNWLLGVDAETVDCFPGSGITADDILGALSEAPVQVGGGLPHGVYDSVTWAAADQDGAAAVWKLHGQTRLVVTSRLTAAVVAGVFGSYEDGMCTVPIGELYMAGVSGGGEWVL